MGVPSSTTGYGKSRKARRLRRTSIDAASDSATRTATTQAAMGPPPSSPAREALTPVRCRCRRRFRLRRSRMLAAMHSKRFLSFGFFLLECCAVGVGAATSGLPRKAASSGDCFVEFASCRASGPSPCSPSDSKQAIAALSRASSHSCCRGSHSTAAGSHVNAAVSFAPSTSTPQPTSPAATSPPPPHPWRHTAAPTSAAEAATHHPKLATIEGAWGGGAAATPEAGKTARASRT
mmetsp:Transcript_44086/g.127245  ORF Transcript_44086/g.127245 Transcript_44086/m.127245 type:complete len:235 (-) Transcript_44086:30-734(-)